MTLHAYLKLEHLSVPALAKRAGLTPTTLYRYLDGSRHPTLAAALRLERATGGRVTPRSLRGRP